MPRTTHLLAALLLALACSEGQLADDPEIPVRVGTVAVDQRNAPVIILEEEHGTRSLPIWIGTAEATSIASQMNNHPPPRPNSHDLAERLIQRLDAKVLRVVVTELREGIFYAELTLRSQGRSITIDVRPSDGIAVALRTDSPILVRASVFEEAGEELAHDPEKQAI